MPEKAPKAGLLGKWRATRDDKRGVPAQAPTRSTNSDMPTKVFDPAAVAKNAGRRFPPRASSSAASERARSETRAPGVYDSGRLALG
jgi:hypothetical protein